MRFLRFFNPKIIVIVISVILTLVAGVFVAQYFVNRSELASIQTETDTRLSRYNNVLRESESIKHLFAIVDEKSYQTAKSSVKMTSSMYDAWFSNNTYTGSYRLPDIPTVNILEKAFIYDDNMSRIQILFRIEVLYVRPTMRESLCIIATYTDLGELVSFGNYKL